MKTRFLFIQFLRFFSILILISLIIPFNTDCQQIRTEVNIPDIPGYMTLKCDFHMHTVFSDGNLWPPLRTAEAWLEGLDAFSITDHIEYQPHEDDIPINHNRSYQLARPSARSMNLLLIKGAEITRSMPPGHFNTLFIQDADPLDRENVMDALKAAVDQGAFIIWNHPGWRQPEEIPIWYEEHTEIYDNGWMHGMEIVNADSYYPKAHQWCLDKKITMIGCSDAHNVVSMSYDFSQGEHRSMTLVFAVERTPEALKEALFARRTAVYYKNTLIGEEQYLKPVFEQSVAIKTPEAILRGTGSFNLQINNNSEVDFELSANGKLENISFPEKITLPAGKTALCPISNTRKDRSGKQSVRIPYKVTNLLIAPGEGLPVELEITVTFIPGGE